MITPQPLGLHVAADRGGRHGPVLLRLAISLRKQRTHLLLEAIWESPTEVVRFGGVLRVLMLQVRKGNADGHVPEASYVADALAAFAVLAGELLPPARLPAPLLI